jgi:hypothetical protein
MTIKKILQRITTIRYLLILVSLSLSGCAGLGQNVSVEDRILFNEIEKSQGRFTQDGLTVDYSYRLVGRNMILDGSANYTRSVDSLNIYLLFLDEGGNVLQRDIVYSSGYRVARSWGMTERTFRDQLVVPQEAVGISFNYYAEPRTSQK